MGIKEIISKIKEWFGVDLQAPAYEKGVSTEIITEYKVNKKIRQRKIRSDHSAGY